MRAVNLGHQIEKYLELILNQPEKEEKPCNLEKAKLHKGNFSLPYMNILMDHTMEYLMSLFIKDHRQQMIKRKPD